MKRQLRLLRYALPHKAGIVLVLVTMGLAVGLAVLQPWPTKVLVDNVANDQPVPPWLAWLPGSSTQQGLLAWVAFSIVLLFVCNTAVSAASEVTSVRMGQRMTFDLGADLFEHLQRQSLIFHSQGQAGDSIARVTGDAYCVQVLVTGALLPTLQSLVMLVVMFVIMFVLSPPLTLIAIAVVPFLAIAIKAFGRPMKDRSRTMREHETSMMSTVQQTLTAMPAIQAFTREPIETARFRSQSDETIAAYMRSTFAGLWFKMFAGLATAIGTAAVVYVGGRLVIDGQLTIGGLLVFISYLASLYGPINSITYTTSTIQGAAARADRVSEILEREPDVTDAPDAKPVALRGHVRYEKVSFGYAPARPAVDGVNLDAAPGEVIAIVGPTGAGKTTLMNLLLRSFDPWEGCISIDGYDLRDLQLRSLRSQIAVVLQEPFIFPLTIADNIAYGRPTADRESVIAAARAASAHEFIERLPAGYDTVVGERGATLSGGEKQRLSIARAFLKDAPILVLDEPTSALDARTEGLLLGAIQRLTTGRTTFIIAHRLSTIRGADTILVLEHGKILERGPHGELLGSGGLYSSLYRQQMDLAEHDGPVVSSPIAGDSN